MIPINHRGFPRVYKLTAVLLALCACSKSSDSVRLVGTLERDRIEIVAEASEPILSLDVREGQHVTQGQVLLKQDTSSAAARAAQADAQIQQAQHRLSELEKGARVEEIDEARARVAAVKAAIERDEREFARVSKLVEDHLVSQTQLDTARAARDASRAAVREAQAQLTALLRGNRVEEIDQARAALAAAEAARRELEVSNSRLLVQATRAGVVDALPFKAGERPPQGAPMVVLLADTAAFARVYVPEPQRVHVRAGTAAKIYVDGLDHPLQGKVRYVASDAAFTPYFALTQRDRSRLTFLCEIEITDDEVRGLPAGVPVEAELEETVHGSN
jgi:HlyD family secretion protein